MKMWIRCNRTEIAVMQECMNIILNREINGVKIPNDVYIVCAMNPTLGMDGFDRSSGNRCNYSTKELDPAQADRLLFITLDSSADSFCDWGTNLYNSIDAEDDNSKKDYIKFDKSMFKTNIHDDVINYINVNKDRLSRHNDNGTIKATPRSWEMVSDIIRTYELNSSAFKPKILNLCIQGLIGGSAEIEFRKFLNENKNPLIKGEEFFKGKKLDEKLFEKYQNETQQRQYMIAKSALLYIAEKTDGDNKKELTAKDKKIYMQVLLELRGENTLQLMRYTRNNFPELHKKLKTIPEYFDNLIELTKAAEN